jgi:hypothetical protein
VSVEDDMSIELDDDQQSLIDDDEDDRSVELAVDVPVDADDIDRSEDEDDMSMGGQLDDEDDMLIELSRPELEEAS